MTEICHDCGEEYSGVTMHWRRSDCTYPEVSEEQHEIIQGCLMGDGHLTTHNKSPIFHVTNTNLQFLRWIEDQLGVLVSQCKLHETAEEKAKVLEGTDFHGSDFDDVYRLSTRTLPMLDRYASWYDGGEKRFPDDLELTPMKLKMWYCCDGTLHSQGNIQIGVKNEVLREDYLETLFEPLNVSPTLANWNLCFSIEDSVTLFEYMGGSVPGMERKWGEGHAR